MPMPTTLLTRVVTIATVLLASAGAWAQALDQHIRALHQQARLSTSTVGVSIIDLGGSSDLADITIEARRNEQGESGFLPASNLKLFTSGAALLVLGSNFEFRTELLRDGNRLIIRGSGDPGFGDPVLLREMGVTVEELLDRMAEMAAQGEPIAEIVIDDRVFDREYIHASWPVEQLNRWYCAQVSGVNFHANVLEIYAEPGAGEGVQPTVQLSPSAPDLSPTNRARTLARGSNSLWAGREVGTNNITLYGGVRQRPEEPLEVTVHEAGVELLGRLLARRIARAGHAAGADVPTVRLAHDADRSGGGTVVGVIRTPLSVVLKRCNESSHNLYADALLKRVGYEVTSQPGSWSSGASVVRMQVRDRVGPKLASDLIVADGSGLSRENRASPRLITAWLGELFEDSAVRNAMLESLPVAGGGQPIEGRLRRWFGSQRPDNLVYAKSGYINGVRCLSGYIVSPRTGRGVAFSILVNNIPPSVPGDAVRAFQTDVVLLADQWLSGVEASMADAMGGE